MQRVAIFLGLFWFCAVSPLFAEVTGEKWAKGAPSAAEAFGRYGTERIGVLLVAKDRNPGLGVRYGETVFSEARVPDSDVHRMPDRFELRLYEAVRAAFREQGYRVRCLNRGVWKGLRLREVMGEAEGVDAVCAVHYNVEQTHVALNREGITWWAPFKGLRLTVRCAVYDLASEDLIYSLEGEAVGTEALYAGLGEVVAEEPLYPGGYDRRGKRSHYKIAIYSTSVRNPKTGKQMIPMIQTPEGTVDISYSRLIPSTRSATADEGEHDIKFRQDLYEPSILQRLLSYVTYLPDEKEIEYFDLMSIERCGAMLRERIPERKP